MLFEEAEDTEDIEKNSLVGLIDMLYDEWVIKESSNSSQTLAPQPKAFSSSDILDILQTIQRECFKLVPNYEVNLSDMEKGKWD